MNVMESLFGRAKSPAERLRENKRALTRAGRELERERIKLEGQEKKLIVDIKKAAKAGQMQACKIMAKDLVRTRKYNQKFYAMKTQLQAVELRIQSLRSNQQMSDAMRGAARAMGSMNKSMNLPQIQRIMMDFEKESSMMDMKEEMMNDSIDDVMEDQDEEEEEEGIIQEVLDEIGISLNTSLKDTPTLLAPNSTSLASTSTQPLAEGLGASSSVDPAEASLQARLDNLRKG